MEQLIRPILLVLEPLHFPQLLLLLHCVRQIFHVLVLVHFQLGLCDLLGPVVYVKDLSIPFCDSPVVVGDIAVALTGDHVQVSFFLVELYLLSDLLLLLSDLILLDLSGLCVHEHCLLVLILVLAELLGCVQDRVIKSVLVFNEAVDRASVLGTDSSVGVYLKLILARQIRQKVLLVDLIGFLVLPQRLMESFDMLEVILLKMLLMLPLLVLKVHLTVIERLQLTLLLLVRSERGFVFNTLLLSVVEGHEIPHCDVCLALGAADGLARGVGVELELVFNATC